MMISPQAQHYVECECGKPSEFFCNTCDVQLCEPCVSTHVRIKSEKGHEITDYAKRKEKASKCLCESHTEIECHLFCNTCDFPICGVCVATKHKQHDMVELQEKTTRVINVITEETFTLQSQIRPVYQKALTRISSRIVTVPLHFSTVRNKLKSTKEAWHKEVDDVIREFEEEVDHMEADLVTNLEAQKDIFEKRLLDIDKTIKENNDTKNSKTADILMFKSNIKQYADVPSLTEFNFPSFISEAIDHKEIKMKIGGLESLKSFTYQQYEMKVKQLENCASRLVKTPFLTPAIDDTKFPPNQNNNRLSSVAHLSHDRVWIGGASKFLMLMDFQGRVLDRVDITCNGNFIAFSPDGHLMYSDPSDNTVKKIGDENTIQTLISTGEWQTGGIAVTSSRYILVCLYKKDQNVSKVVRYSEDGLVVQEIQFDTNNEPLYNLPWYIAVNKNDDICTVNFNSKTLVVVDRYGQLRFKYDGKKQHQNVSITSIVTDLHGNIFISDPQNNAIHMLDIDGRFIRLIAPKGLEIPRGICILGNGNLCVGECKTGKIKVIKYLKD